MDIHLLKFGAARPLAGKCAAPKGVGRRIRLLGAVLVAGLEELLEELVPELLREKAEVEEEEELLMEDCFCEDCFCF
jgi:hypothetical protein